MAIKIDALGSSSATAAHLVREAGSAGATLGNSGKSVRNCIREAATAGITDYQDSTVKSMRTAYAEGAVAHGTTRNNGLGLFARAWDDVAKEGRLAPRPKRGTGRNAGKSGNAGDASAKPDKGAGGKTSGKAGKYSEDDLANAKIEAFQRGVQHATAQINANIDKVKAKAAYDFATKHLPIQTLVDAVIAARHAANMLKGANVDSTVKDLAYTNKALCDMIGKAFAAVDADIKPIVADAIKADAEKRKAKK